jgi:flagellar basal-body rod protein FlgC
MTQSITPRNEAMAVAASALRAQQSRMRIIAENIANADSTARTPGGDPYRRQIPVFEARQVDGATGVSLAEVRPDQRDFRREYDPTHPAADAEGLETVEAATIEAVWRELSPAEPQPAVPQDDAADGARGEPRFRAVRRLWG